MPKYYVYDTETGEVVHSHEVYDVTSGQSMPCSSEEVLAVVDESLRDRSLDVVEANVDRPSAGHLLRVDTTSGAVVQEPRSE
ncbi:hypothetical protein SAMN05660209_05004 [Geodermatophilus africanus]|uniref:Uncharacterized protein n=1 Tax=Geodermatophilus africanus TaxID=1137993 RepID=A0A1H3R3I5_9ACTN|nr:hypothetical protein [Geodermatophilus africanus]SDZ20083.1 hypothetical protein SAMN05660209_05004 [Geodermatophilus africanus]